MSHAASLIDLLALFPPPWHSACRSCVLTASINRRPALGPRRRVTMKQALLIYAFTMLVLINFVKSMAVSDPEAADGLQWPRPVRVRRSLIVYNQCPEGYKRMPPPLGCIPCKLWVLQVLVIMPSRWNLVNWSLKLKQAIECPWLSFRSWLTCLNGAKLFCVFCHVLFEYKLTTMLQTPHGAGTGS